MFGYFLKAKMLGDGLAVAGHPVSNYDHILYILSSLGSDYDVFVTSITVHSENSTIDDLHGMFLNQESRLENNVVSLDSPTANLSRGNW